ncbi:MAG: hypothetical protein ACRDNS_26050, partial [Trebonia sp.]
RPQRRTVAIGDPFASSDAYATCTAAHRPEVAIFRYYQRRTPGESRATRRALGCRLTPWGHLVM